MSYNPIFRFALREDLKNEKLFLPTRGEPLATGWDVRAAFPDRKTLTVQPFEYAKIPLGFRAFCPEGWWYEIRPRSSSFAKKNLHALYGVVDETYENELVFACQYIPYVEFQTDIDEHHPSYSSDIDYRASTQVQAPNLHISFGDAVGQIIPVRRQHMGVEEITNEEYDMLCKQRNAQRGIGGFGSTGK